MLLPKISVITPSYNQGAYLEETIISVLSQSYPNLEFLILDGGSTDESVEIIKKYANQLTFWRSHRDSGQSSAIAEGFDRATGEILAWLNSDDCYEPGTLKRIAEEFQRNPDAIMVYGDYYVLRQDQTRVLKPKVSCDFKVMAHAYLMIPQPSSFWKKTAYDAVGGLDTELNYAMDYDLFLKLAKRYPPKQIIHLPIPLSTFRLHEESKSVGSKTAFGPECQKVVARLIGSRPRWQMRLLRYVYLAKVELMYLVQRGYIPLRKDRTKA